MNDLVMDGSPSRVVYSGHSANWPILILSVVLAAPLIIIAVANGGSLGDLLVALLIVLLVVSTVVTSSSLRSTIGPSGASVRFGVFGLPRFHWSLEEIERAEAVDISPWSQMVGVCWWSPAGGWKLAVRSGTAVRLTLTNGRYVTFNVEDSAAAIAALEAARHP
jgi:hypothetical protein